LIPRIPLDYVRVQNYIGSRIALGFLNNGLNAVLLRSTDTASYLRKMYVAYRADLMNSLDLR